jgi:hypothetical protein
VKRPDGPSEWDDLLSLNDQVKFEERHDKRGSTQMIRYYRTKAACEEVASEAREEAKSLDKYR